MNHKRSLDSIFLRWEKDEVKQQRQPLPPLELREKDIDYQRYRVKMFRGEWDGAVVGVVIVRDEKLTFFTFFNHFINLSIIFHRYTPRFPKIKERSSSPGFPRYPPCFTGRCMGNCVGC